jgi:nicotinamidase-related amidase
MRSYEESPWLICLDLRSDYVSQEHPLFDKGALRILPQLRSLMDRGRRNGWRLLHSVNAQRRIGAAIKGLEPRPDEAVFKRPGVSAFSSPHLRTLAQEENPIRIFVAGFGLGTTALATAIVGAELGLPITLVEDAVSATAIGDRSADEIARVVKAIAPAFATLTTVDAVDFDGPRIVSMPKGLYDD